jgi:hemin uptake protein HemP
VIERASERVGRIREAGETTSTEGRIASAELFRGRRDIVILHRGQEYRLRITRSEKLILTK